MKSNTSSQLALYQQMFAVEVQKNVDKVGYFLMPEGRLYSKSDFNGDFAIKIEPDDNSDLVEKMRNSYRFRKEQILSGVLENAECTPAADTAYCASAVDRNLFPAAQDKDGSKSQNMFSNYGIFKN